LRRCEDPWVLLEGYVVRSAPHAVTRNTHVHLSDMAGLNQLAIALIAEVIDLTETLHNSTAHSPGIADTAMQAQSSAIAALVYESIRGVTRLVGDTTDAILAQPVPVLDQGSSREREAVLAVLNGLIGDYLAATGNPLAISMRLRRNGQRLRLDSKTLSSAVPPPRDKLLLLVHGLCMNDLQWTRNGRDFGVALARDLGYTPIYLHYNSGLHVSTNGRALAALIENLVQQWPEPLKEFTILAHSMGGLVSRSAYYYGMKAGQAWPQQLRKLVFLGTPHHGALLERGGNWIHLCLGLSPYTAPFARLARLRSAGITDLRYGNVLEEDWQGFDRFEHAGDLRHPVPLPEGVRCYAIAANVGKKETRACDLLGDGMVPVSSALGRHEDRPRTLSFAPSHQWIGHGMNHWEMLSKPAVYAQIKRWIASEPHSQACVHPRGRGLPLTKLRPCR
jgi:pimeloyl-ACP methyl ester carboxylesterase